jgi:flagellar assembly protein FliH
MMDGLAALFQESDIFTPRSMLPDDAQAGILYVEDFDAPPEPQAAPAPEEPPPPPPPPPTYSLAEYDQACAAAHEAGLQAGLDEARQEHAAVQAQLRGAALSAIADALSAGEAERAAVARGMAGELASTLLAMLQAALPAASASLAGGEVTALLNAVLPPLRREPSLHIQVHSTLLEDVAADLAPFRAQHAGTLLVTANDDLPPADVVVRWADGEMRRDTAALWEELRLVLAPFALPAPAASAAPANRPKGAQNGQ